MPERDHRHRARIFGPALATLLGVCLLASPIAATAQPAAKVARLGWLSLNLTQGDPRPRDAFLQALRDLGYVEGRNLAIEYRDAAGMPDRLPGLAAELVALKPDVIMSSGGTLGTLAVKRATASIPVVFGAVGDPVAEGIVASVARPGGNVTGLAVQSTETLVKAVELAKQAVPGASRVALLLKPDAMPERAMRERVKAADEAARALGMRLHVVEARTVEDLDRAFSDASKARADAITVLATPLFDSHRQRIAELAGKHRLPAVYSFRRYVDAGGLTSYGPDITDLFRRAATYVDKILKGARPEDLPVEQPTKFELVVNLKAARALKLTLPPSLLQRADEVIQ